MLLWVLAGATLSVPGQYATIQDALVAASAGDVVEVDAGTWSGGFDLGFDVTLRSTGGASVTTLVGGEGVGPVVLHAGTQSDRPLAHVQGFTIDGELERPCAIALRSQLVGEDLVFTGCGTADLGGVYADDATLTLRGVDGAGRSGGSLVYALNSELTVEDSRFTGGEALYGAHVYAEDSVVVVARSTFEGAVGWDEGGALSVWGSEVTLSDDTFVDNGANANGGAAAIGWGPTALVERCTFLGNGVGTDGGALFTYAQGRVDVVDSTFDENVAYDDGGAVAIEAADFGAVTRCAFTQNEAGWGAAVSVAFSLGSELAGNTTCRNWAYSAGGAFELWGDRYDYVPQQHDVHHNVLVGDENGWGGNIAVSFGEG